MTDEPLRWDSTNPVITFDSGLRWDGVAAAAASNPKKKKSMNTKAIIDFSGYTAAELGPVALHIHSQMTDHAADFTNPPMPLADLGTLVADYC